MVLGREGLNDQPGGGNDRAWKRDVINRARAQVEQRGLTLTNADLQALWWYPEKDLYSKLAGRSSEALNTDFASEMRLLAKKKGISDDDIEAGARAGAVRPLADGPGSSSGADDGRGDDRGGEEGDGADGGGGGSGKARLTDEKPWDESKHPRGHPLYVESQELQRKNGSEEPNDSWSADNAQNYRALQDKQRAIYDPLWKDAGASRPCRPRTVPR